MISVLADTAQSSVVREFFELFKTPWEFYREGPHYDTLICSNTEPPRSSAKLVLIYGTRPRLFDRENGIEIRFQRSNSVISYKDKRIPIYGNCLTFAGPATHGLIDESDQASVGQEITSQHQTFIRIGFDLFGEIRHLLTRGQPPAHAAMPTLELHIALLRDLITSCAIPLVEILPLPSGYNFIVCLTHDVDHWGIRNYKFDHTMFGFLYRALIGSVINFCRGRKSLRQVAVNWMAAFSLPFVHLGLAKDFWNDVDRYLEIEKGLTSTFFLIPSKGEPGHDAGGRQPSRRAARYQISEIVPQVNRLLGGQCEVGLHGIDAWRDTTKGRAELERIRQITGQPEIGVRMHWLFFDEKSPAALEKAGFSYDSTIGYNETVGYRAGTTQAFRPLEVERMLELPMHVMDTALFYPSYLDLSPKQARAVVQPLIENAARFGGVLTVNWHDRSLGPERLWDDFYVGLLEDLKSRGAWFPTASQAVSWFRKRRSAVIESVIREGDSVRVKVSIDHTDADLPGLTLRVHKPPARSDAGPNQTKYHTNLVDIEFNNSAEFEI
jgi:peptidoglycan/xylan/chitin deacetylase (PgdA/CDA1 family)